MLGEAGGPGVHSGHQGAAPQHCSPHPQPQLDRNVDDMRSQLGETAANNEERFGLLEEKAKMQVGWTGLVAVIALL